MEEEKGKFQGEQKKPRQEPPACYSFSKLHEYQAKEIISRYGIPFQQYIIASNPGEVKEYAEKLKKPVVIKAQVLVGGRGKAGGIKIADTPNQAEQIAENILGMELKGLQVDKVMAAEAVSNIESEFYVGITYDGKEKKPVFILSVAGGIDIEETAQRFSEKIEKFVIDPISGVSKGLADKMAMRLTGDEEIRLRISVILMKLYEAFMENDCFLLEVNPLIVSDGEVIALDAKINLDENALFRHPEFQAYYDPKQLDANEQEAKASGLSFIKLSGDIGCIVNGAGLAMATMDGIKNCGGLAANFLDVGGSSKVEKMVKAFEVILRDKKVKVILVNIFGGITRCDDIARGIVEAKKLLNLPVPIVVRLTGTNRESGNKILEGVEGIIPARKMSEAIQKSVETTTKSESAKDNLSKWIRKDRFPPIWCFGCGNNIVLRMLLNVFESKGYSRNDVVIVSGIGCSGRIATYINANTVHTTHGRALTVATGIKMANPSLKVVVVMGDGDAASIGGNHLIHASRRNVDLMALIINNNIYGMTGGQLSPTTPQGAFTSTTPKGSNIKSFDISHLVKEAGACYVARTTALHTREMKEYLNDALDRKGFGLVEVMTPCPTVFGRRNNLGGAGKLMQSIKNNSVSIHDAEKLSSGQLSGKIITGVFKNCPDLQAPYDFIRKKKAVEKPLLFKEGKRFLWSGNKASVEAALQAGCRFFAGYPITPSSEILEELSLKRISFIQTEDEIAAIGAAIGASLAGVKALTATSGPGFSLKQENLGLAVMYETPVVILNVMRVGPSTGLPTKPAQADIMQAIWGTHGDASKIVMALSSVEDSYKGVIHAFNLAEKYSVPVVVLSDAAVAQTKETISIKEKAKVFDRKAPEVPPSQYEPYSSRQRDEKGVPHKAALGTGYLYHHTGLIHEGHGYPTSKDEEMAVELLHSLTRKIEGNEKDIRWVRHFETEDAREIIVAYGSVAQSAREAVTRARQAGKKLGLLQLVVIWPFPSEEIQALVERKGLNKLYVPELNQGQLVNYVKLAAGKYMDKVESIPFIRPRVIKPSELLLEIYRESFSFRRSEFYADICLSGVGGQGLITAGFMLAQAALYQGKYAAETEVYAEAARGGESTAKVIIDSEPINYPEPETFNYLVTLNRACLDKYLPKLRKGGVIISDSSQVNIDEALEEQGMDRNSFTLVSLPFAEVADKHLKPMVLNVLVLGAFSELYKIVDQDCLERAVIKKVPQKFLELNKAAFELGKRMGREFLNKSYPATLHATDLPDRAPTQTEIKKVKALFGESLDILAGKGLEIDKITKISPSLLAPAAVIDGLLYINPNTLIYPFLHKNKSLIKVKEEKEQIKNFMVIFEGHEFYHLLGYSEKETRRKTLEYLVEKNMLESHLNFLNDNGLGIIAEDGWLKFLKLKSVYGKYLIGKETRVIVQGITGRDGSFHAVRMKAGGTNIVGGVTPGKGGQEVEGIPVFNAVKEAVEKTSADTSIIFVPPRFASGAILEAAEAGIKRIIVITEGIPLRDIAEVYARIEQDFPDTVIIGPNCPGIVRPGYARIGIMPDIFTPGYAGIVSRSGTLTYEVANSITEADIGQSTVIGIGGDMLTGTTFIDAVSFFEADEQTKVIVLIGEIGGTAEEEAAEFIKHNISKPVYAFIAGRGAPKDKRMGHAGAIISGGKGEAEDKVRALESAGVQVFSEPDKIGELLKARAAREGWEVNKIS